MHSAIPASTLLLEDETIHLMERHRKPCASPSPPLLMIAFELYHWTKLINKLLNNIHKVYRDPRSNEFGHSFLLQRKQGNVLVPRMDIDARITEEYDAIEDVGGSYIVLITD